MRLSWTIQASTLAGAEKQLESGKALGYTSFNVKLANPRRRRTI